FREVLPPPARTIRQEKHRERRQSFAAAQSIHFLLRPRAAPGGVRTHPLPAPPSCGSSRGGCVAGERACREKAGNHHQEWVPPGVEQRPWSWRWCSSLRECSMHYNTCERSRVKEDDRPYLHQA